MSTTHQAISSYAKMITKSQNQDVANVDTKVKGLSSQSMIRSIVKFIIRYAKSYIFLSCEMALVIAVVV